MSKDQKSWREQLHETRSEIHRAGEQDQFGERDGAHPVIGESQDLDASTQPSTDLPRAEPLRAAPQRRSTDNPESVVVTNGKLTVKAPGGDVVIPLSKEQSDEFVHKALHYQQAIIREKKANVFATYAMAMLSGLSAVAIGTTLVRSFSSKSKTSVI